MRYKHIGHGLPGYYKMADLELKFKNMTKSAETKRKALMFWIDHSLEAAMDAHGVSQPTMYRWKQLYHEHGNYGLEDKSKAPITCNNRRDNWDRRIVEFIKDYRGKHRKCGGNKLHRPLLEYCQRLSISCPSRKTIDRIISDNKRIMNPKSKGKRDKKHYPSTRDSRRPNDLPITFPGQCFATDNIHIRVGNKKFYMITGIDLRTRFALVNVSTSISSKTAADFMGFVTKAFPFKVEHVLSDNGSEFKKFFAKLLDELDIKHWKIYPGKPQMNAVCERFNRTIKEDFIEDNKHLLLSDQKQFYKNLADWLYWYNTERSHHGLDYNTPMEKIKTHQNSNMLWLYTKL